MTTDPLLGASLEDDILKTADLGYNDHVGLGVKSFKEVTTAIQGAIILAKLPIVFLQNGYHRNKIGKPHSNLCRLTGHCGCAHPVCPIPVPRGNGNDLRSCTQEIASIAVFMTTTHQPGAGQLHQGHL